MKHPKYMESDAYELISKWETLENEIISNESVWIKKSLEILYNDINVLEYSIRPNPYAIIKNYIVDGKSKMHIMMPKFLATQNIEFYWAELTGVDLFLVSIFKYNSKISGKEILDYCIADSIDDKRQLMERLNIVIRKFLSYQYVVLT